MAGRKGPHTIDKIGEHVEEKSYKDQLKYRASAKKDSEEIKGNGNFRMQWMKTYSAAVRIEDGCGKEMIDIYQHGRQQNKPVPLPVLSVINVGDAANSDKVQEVMKGGLEHVAKLGNFR